MDDKMLLKIQGSAIGVSVVLCLMIRDPRYMCVILALCVCVLFLSTQLLENRKEKQLSQLITYLTTVQDQLDLPEMKCIKEGQIGILQSEIYKVIILLQEAYSQEANKKKYMADMLSNISHQIKTPIAAITIMTDLLESPDLSETDRLEYAAKIDKQVSRITWLIRNLLTLSQLEADVLVFQSRPVQVRELFQKVIDSLELMAEVKDVSLSIHIDSDIILICDEHWTHEAFSNVVKNCIEHTPCGGHINVDVFQDNVATHIRIEDDGNGIAKEHLPHIFERFYKAGNNSKNSVGIGLSMSKQIILRQNGTITVTSEVGKGTVFIIKMYRTDTL